MRKIYLAVGLLFTGLACLAQAQVPMTGAGKGAPGGGFTPSCSQSTSFLARTSGLSNGTKTAYDTYICGLVSDTAGSGCTTSLFNCFDAIYIFATTDTTTAQLSLVSSTFNVTLTNSPTFTAGGASAGGYTGNGTNSLVSSNFNPSTASSPKYVQDNAVHFIWSNTAVADASGSIACDGAQVDTGHAFIYPRTSGNAAFFGTQDDSGYTATVASTDGSGLFAGERVDHSTEKGWRNGSQIVTNNVVASSVINDTLVFGAGDGSFCVRQIMAAGIGASLGSTAQAALYARTHTILQTLAGIP